MNGASYVFTVSVSKHVLVFDTTITDNHGVLDTTWFALDSVIISYDTVQNANALIVSEGCWAILRQKIFLCIAHWIALFFLNRPVPNHPT
jgi:hypothetical protein